MNYLIKQDSGLYKCYWLVQELKETLEQDDFNKFNTLVNDKSILPRYMFTAIKTLRKYSNISKNLRAGIIKKLSKELTMKEIDESNAISINTV